MPSSIAHGLTAVAVGTAFYPVERPRYVYTVAALGAVLVDLDAVGRPFGYGDLAFFGGHRALTHSLSFAALLSLALVAIAYRGSPVRHQPGRTWICLALAFGAHGILDAFTTYGAGVMFFAPFSAERFKSPWLPLTGILSEMIGIWLPMLAFIAYRRLAAHSGSRSVRPNEEL